MSKSEDHSADYGHLPVLDTWRGLAILLLLVGHFARVPKINCGRLGVEFFFVLSGFLMGRLLFVKQTPIGLFYRRRISRIFPAAYAFLAIVTVAEFVKPYGAKPSPGGIASCFLFYVNYYLALPISTARLVIPADHFWSLCVEEHTYIFLSIVAVLHRRSGLSPLFLLVVSILAVFTSATSVGISRGWDYYQVYWRTDCRASSILLGAVASYLSFRGAGHRPNYFGLPTIALGPFITLLGVLLNFSKFPDIVKYTAGSAALATGLLLISKHGLGRLGIFRPVAWLGTISYSLYLCQQPFYHSKERGEISSLTAITCAFSVAMASYFFIERPTRKWLNARWAN
jgi:peptidoglycan/LPS O-acetylase OafA/YrhL